MKQLNLRSVVSLVPEDYPTVMQEFYNANGIQLLSHGLEGNKWPFKEIDQDCLQLVLRDAANRPLLIHCNKGKHRTGSVVGSLRKVRGWALSAIFSEYLHFAAPKSRLEDQQLIEIFQFKKESVNPAAVVITSTTEETKEETRLQNQEITNSTATACVSSANPPTDSDVTESSAIITKCTTTIHAD